MWKALLFAFALLFTASAGEPASFVLGIAPNVGSPGQSIQVAVRGVGFSSSLNASQISFGTGITVASVGAVTRTQQVIDGTAVTVDTVPVTIQIASTATLGARAVRITGALGFSAAVFIVVQGSTPGGPPPPGLRFSNPVSFPAHFGPTTMDSRDLTGDNILDLIVGAPGSNSMLLYRGLSTGRLATAKAIRNDSAVADLVAVADFNGDAKWDVVSGDRNAAKIDIWIGLGGLNLKRPVHVNLAASPTALATGDFNGDTKKDVAVASRDTNQLYLLLGNGNGTFQPPKAFQVGDTPKSMAVGDLNKDGLDDVVVGNFTNAISILKGSRTSGLLSQLKRPAPTSIEGLAIADLNGDSNPDVAAIGGDSIMIYRGKGTGDVFLPVKRLKEGNFSWNLALSDFNGDSRIDIAFINAAAGQVSVLVANGNLTYKSPITYNTGDVPQDVIVGDFNRDQKPDLAVSNSGNSSNLSILLNQNSQ